MDNRLLVNRPIQRPQQVNQRQDKPIRSRDSEKSSFKDILARQLKEKDGVKFSKHAQTRLMSRDITVTEEDLNQLRVGVEKAAAKGARDTLILVNNVAYVVSVENKTVITAVDDGHMKDRIFTNIDSAVFMD
ncbi:MAG: hypothetical protein PWR10_622 [Halanaerobiales bacterium]|nr:hypothetical protein [Halanaerobiales bacterium]